jgi:hypothetical protein
MPPHVMTENMKLLKQTAHVGERSPEVLKKVKSPMDVRKRQPHPQKVLSTDIEAVSASY